LPRETGRHFVPSRGGGSREGAQAMRDFYRMVALVVGLVGSSVSGEDRVW
jgi:hypothetical protein